MKLVKKKKFSDSFWYAFYGLKHTFINEMNFRIQLICSIMVIILGFIFKISLIEWIVCLLLISFVLVIETINTGYENMVDLIIDKYHPKAKIVKDLLASAVLIVNIFAMIIGLIIFIPKI